MRIKKIDSDTVKLCETTKVKLKTAGNTRVVQFTAGNNKSCPVQNLSKETYLDKKTGEIKQKKKSENRYQSPKSARKSINRLGDLIRCNATDPAKCKWITVTYENVMTDGKQAFQDAKQFLRKLKRYLAKQNNITTGQKLFKYITVAEPQGEQHGNSWHLHILLIFDDTAPFIENETIAGLWGHGITSTHEVFDGDDLQLTKRAERLPHNPNTPGKIEGDHAGHLAGDRFRGSPEIDNLVSQSSSVNLSEYKKIENQWAKAIGEGKKVTTNVEILYDGDSLRPKGFKVRYTIDGVAYSKRILN